MSISKIRFCEEYLKQPEEPTNPMKTTCSLLLLALLSCSSADAAETKPTNPRSRQFRLDIGATITGLPAGSTVRVWLPIPPSTRDQSVKALVPSLPARGQRNKESKYGNQILYFQKKVEAAGSLRFNTPYQVRRHEVRALKVSKGQQNELSPAEKKLYLSPNQKVPLAGKPLALLAKVDLAKDPPLDLARQLYNRVDEHVRYDKSQPGYGNGDVLWVCNSKFGNCTDFHSLFISFARSQGLPARFEIGFPLPEKRGAGSIGGYHCWALFHIDSYGWIPVDISEADKHPEMKEYYFGNLTENRVTFTKGRDIDLVPQQTSPSLNYFVYPHIEVDGKQWPREKIQLKFTYQDQ